ncbi:30S ribosomal protein S13 [Rickettsiales bacterium (ex Bugula neritina AB1)]|nr:30S ribosomal protein S13 [Rickettsiales bacterium (ex Bugula neritina AB1)]
MEIMGFNIPEKKRIIIALTYIKGIGKSMSKKILNSLGIDHNKHINQLENKEINLLINTLNKKDEFNNYIYKIGNELDVEIIGNIKEKVLIRSRSGQRLMLGLTLRGRTHSNGKTAKKNKRKNFNDSSKKIKKGKG